MCQSSAGIRMPATCSAGCTAEGGSLTKCWRSGARLRVLIDVEIPCHGFSQRVGRCKAQRGWMRRASSLRKFQGPGALVRSVLYRPVTTSAGMPWPPSRTRRGTRASAVCGEGSQRYNTVTRQPAALHSRSLLAYARPEHVVSKAKLKLSPPHPGQHHSPRRNRIRPPAEIDLGASLIALRGLRFPQSYARTSTVLVDELHAGRLERAANG
jgi:hypothetical protein